MKWNQALNLILSNITLNLDLDPSLRFKIVIDVPPFQCHRNNFNGNEGFKVQVGQGVNNFVEIPIVMLETIFNESVNNYSSIYNNEVFRECYPNLISQRPCYVQSVGKIFSMSGVARQNGRSYKIL
jgi:hypothetical protein